MKRFYGWLFLLLFALPAAAQDYSVDLGGSWSFRKNGDTTWMRATVPGTVHTDLLANKKIDDPYFGDNEKKLQWIEDADWEYQRTFTVTQDQLAAARTDLVFDGLDTYATVYLNDKRIAETDDMFLQQVIDVKGFLHAGENTLRIMFRSAVRNGKAAAARLPYALPGDEKVFTRKAQYQYGWDWGPRFVTCGIWRGVRLEGWSMFRITDFTARLDSMNADGSAVIVFKADYQCTKRNVPAVAVTITDVTDGAVLLQQTGQKYRNMYPNLYLRATLPNAKRWWCRGYGDQPLYTFRLTISDSSGNAATATVRTGLRTIALRQDSSATGTGFTFVLNGVPVFCKGANYIPPDNFMPRVTAARYKSIIAAACAANMNMLRVWGGGVYEDEKFYSLCDSAGLLVWQDFMFACAMYPGDTDFGYAVKAEAEYNVKRLEPHPCMALWCGNNEVDEGWKNWEWQQQYKWSPEDSALIWHDYQELFHNKLQRIVHLNSQLPYRPSSPLIGWGHPESLQQGDAHYWGVWWGMEPFSVYDKKVGRFMSEYGFQGMPALATLRSCMNDSSLHFGSATMKAHQKHPTGYETIQTYMDRDYRRPKDFAQYIYVSQLLQAEGIRTAIEAHRRARPYCMGTLYWQLNDCWPVTSWSSVDAAGRWKALHYTVRAAYADVIVSVTERNDSTLFYIVNDRQVAQQGQLVCSVQNFRGKTSWKKTIDVDVPAAASKCVYGLPTRLLADSAGAKRVFLAADFSGKAAAASATHYFTAPKNLDLPEPSLSTKISVSGDSVTVEIRSKTLAKHVWLSLPGDNVFFDDNFFDVLPRTVRTVHFRSSLPEAELRRQLVVQSLTDSY